MENRAPIEKVPGEIHKMIYDRLPVQDIRMVQLVSKPLLFHTWKILYNKGCLRFSWFASDAALPKALAVFDNRLAYCKNLQNHKVLAKIKHIHFDLNTYFHSDARITSRAAELSELLKVLPGTNEDKALSWLRYRCIWTLARAWQDVSVIRLDHRLGKERYWGGNWLPRLLGKKRKRLQRLNLTAGYQYGVERLSFYNFPNLVFSL
ncbi:hypothetical protein GQ53DRAFT_830347 [Thozetella sp. PMI_491]|nr:hypothetical protein GQ53DRAFT_830347 [Thozetella sp. PMI_491]